MLKNSLTSKSLSFAVTLATVAASAPAQASTGPLPPSKALAVICKSALGSGTQANDKIATWKELARDFELNSRAMIGVKEAELERAAQARIGGLRSELAEIEKNYPQGFNTHKFRQREGIRVNVVSYLRLGQEHALKSLFAKTVTEFRHLHRDYTKLGELREEVMASYLEAKIELRPGLAKVLADIETNRAALKEDMGKVIWEYSGIVSAMLEQAGLTPRSGLIAGGIERTLLNDRIRTFTETVSSAVKSVASEPATEAPAPPTQTPDTVARLAAISVMKSLRILGADGKTELSPTLVEVGALLDNSAVMRVGKLESEIRFEKTQQRVHFWLSKLSDQKLRSILISIVNKATLEKYKEQFDSAQKDLDRGVNEHLHTSRVLAFAGFAERLPDNEVGNAQLAEALISLIKTSPGMLESIALAEEGIDPLRRVKTTKLVKETIWGRDGKDKKKLIDVIEENEAKREEKNLYSAADNSNRRRTNYALLSTATLAATITISTQASVIAKYGTMGYEYAVEAIKKVLGL